MVTEADFDAARKTAIECLLAGNRLIHAALEGPREEWGHEVITLPSEISSFCEVLDEGYSKIHRIDEYLLQIASIEPIEWDGRTESTAHALAWDFAHGLWRSVQLAVDDAVIRAGGSPERSGTFQPDAELVERNLDAIREKLRQRKPMDDRFMRMIQSESAKAKAAWRAVAATAEQPPPAGGGGVGVPSVESGKPKKANLEDKAIALLLNAEYGANVTKIAKEIDVPRTTLAGWKRFKDALNRMTGKGKSPPKGYKNSKTGELEAWNDDD